jgi:tRNA A37 methylthiotransferase MiaB
MYSPRPMTAATKVMKDDVSYEVKKRRWQILEELINKPKLKKINNTSSPSKTNYNKRIPVMTGELVLEEF